MIKSIRKKTGRIKAGIRDHCEGKYISYHEAILAFFKNKKIRYLRYDLSSIRAFKTSDTIFVLGSGPSLNQLSNINIDIIKKHDSIGINYSFLKKEITPTFHQFSWEKTIFQKYLVERFSSYRTSYKDVVILVNSKAARRMAHPRLTPFLFPEDPKYCMYTIPDSITLKDNRSFYDDDFERTLFYRGTLSLVLDIISKIGYKKIVLLGVDLNTSEHFFNDLPEMQELIRLMQEANLKIYGGNKKFESMYTKGGKSQPFDEYLFSLSDYLIRKRGIHLFTGYKNNMLYPKIPAYFD
ncbi:MAG: hypothetical protein ACUZ8N_15560 [Candidatus Scalindua sp.]